MVERSIVSGFLGRMSRKDAWEPQHGRNIPFIFKHNAKPGFQHWPFYPEKFLFLSLFHFEPSEGSQIFK